MGKPFTGDEFESDVLERHEVKEPSRYKVLLHNDDYTTMEFVVEILMKVFHRSEAEATRIMLAVHHEGVGVCGVFSAEVAETKVDLVHRLARGAGFPLKCTMEKE
ncbi:ATP-dependent Clp protease adapter ClpS [Salidesulfovibrio brasiliensis]|uniref:ATP-dependent Clp protease adapter ClpS n=1 Tax=Salidesulfovibrio brasiliensis TaxID=221711 RepID=UPI0006D28C87|nr:ATP-dependent Clp protease adapter ClpS [Salidesulfovibrio brasiliensis]